jgi:uncharacterized protein YceK
MKSKLFVFIILIYLLLLSGCQSKVLSFTGESENWSAKVKYTQNDDLQEKELILTYLGNDVNSVGEIEFNVDSNDGGFDGTGFLKKGGTFQAKGNMSRGGAILVEKAKIVVTIEWNDKKEEIILENK